MPVTLLDLIVIGVMLISALLAMVRGFTREILAIAAWAVAAVAALLLFSHVLPYVTPYIKNELLAKAAAGGGVFVIVLLIASFITIRISDMILDSRIGEVDRTFGFLFGAARGLLLAVVAFTFFNYFVPEEKSEPVWMQNAKSREILISGRSWLLGLLPSDPQSMVNKLLRDNHVIPPDAGTASPDADPDAAGAQTPAPQTQPATPAAPQQ